MPELPEVETTRRGIAPHIKNKIVTEVIIRQARLRWPIPGALSRELPGHSIESVRRRGKYLLLQSTAGTLLIHLGMSGSIRIVNTETQFGKHDHVDIVFQDKTVMRFTDPRRFGCVLWQRGKIEDHPLLISLGPEPLSSDFDGRYLFKQSRKRGVAIKSFIMNSRIVVGVGNIYANEALFLSGINPKRAAGKISLPRYQILTTRIQGVLRRAIDVGGTTLRDFTGSDGDPGYFKQSLNVYGRGGMACKTCGKALKEIRLGQRSTVYCTNCQK